MENNKEKFQAGVMNIVSQYAVSDVFRVPLVAACTCERMEDYYILYLIYPEWNESLDIMSHHGRYFHQLYKDTDTLLKAYTLEKSFIEDNLSFFDQDSMTVLYDRDGIFNPIQEKKQNKQKTKIKRK